MTYEKTIWKARKGSNLNRFGKSQETASSVILYNEPNSITEHGTPINVENMNKIEQGIYDAHGLIADEKQARQEADNNLQQQVESRIPETARGSANGIATLDGTGNIPAAQLGNTPGGGSLATQPHRWPSDGTEVDLGDGSYVRRFVGNIPISNVNTWENKSLFIDPNAIIPKRMDSGGTVSIVGYQVSENNPVNLGYSFSIGMSTSVFNISLNVYSPVPAAWPYDVWVRYTK